MIISLKMYLGIPLNKGSIFFNLNSNFMWSQSVARILDRNLRKSVVVLNGVVCIQMDEMKVEARKLWNKLRSRL